MLPRLRSHLPTWRRALRRRRRVLVGLAVAALVAAVLPSMLPPSVRGADVVVTDVAVEPGTVLTASLLRTVRIAEDLVPDGTAHEIDGVLGRTVRVPLDAGAPVLPGMLESSDAAAVPDGSVLMAVPVPEALVPHLRPGTAIELLPTDPAYLADSGVRARVLEVVPSRAGTSALGGTAAGTAEALVTIERSRAGEVAHALGMGAVVVTVIG